MRARLIAIGFGLSLAAAGCGGPQDKPPGPLSHHFDENFILRLSVDDQKSVIQAQGEYDLAKREQAKAAADEDESKSMLDIAKNELQAAKLDEKSAGTRKSAADASADTTRVNEATKEQRGAELARRAAEQRVSYLNAYRAWLHVAVRFTQENTFYKEAQLQLAEAALARQKNISPKGFKYEDYENQEAERRSRINTAKEKADSAKANAMGERTKWLAIQGEADKTLGKKSDFPDPMMPRPEGPASAGGGGYTLGAQGTSDTHVPTADDPTKQPPPPPSNGSGSGSGSP
jgi:hypothetical protein